MTYTEMSSPVTAAKVLHFPDDRCYGTVVVRDWGGPVAGGFRDHWEAMDFEPIAPAQGAVEVPAGKEVRLSLAEETDELGAGLDLLQPDDLQYVTADGWKNRVRWTDADCRHLARLHGLVWVSLIGAQLTDAGLRWLGGLTRLRHLDLHRIETFTDEGVAHLAALTQLETFFFVSPRISDVSMAIIGEWASLRQIRINNAELVTDAGMAYLAKCRKLTNIFVPRRVSWKGIAHLAELPIITLVVWGNKNINDEALPHLVPILKGMPLTGLDAGQTAITDAGLHHLRGLRLDWCDVTAEGVTDEANKALVADVTCAS